jgi:urea transport system substrate-binding protein
MIRAIVEDGASDPRVFNERASRLVLQENTPTTFGCYTSASRKAVLPVYERRNNMLFYPTYYEGSECSKNVVYTGAVPNQQLSNFIPWIVNTLGKTRFFIVGSNYIYPREMSRVSKILMEQHGAEWVADEYLELGHSEWGAMVNRIRNSGCDVVLSNVVGDSVVAFYREFANQGLTHDELPICATVTSEIEIAAMGAEFAAGSYTSFPYFQAIPSDENQAFIERYRAFVGDPNAVTHHAMESSYFQVYLWKQAVEVAGEASPDAIRKGVENQVFDVPNGKVTIAPENLHAYLTPRISQWNADGQGEIIDEFAEPVMPLPYVSAGESADSLICTADGVDTSRL